MKKLLASAALAASIALALGCAPDSTVDTGGGSYYDQSVAIDAGDDVEGAVSTVKDESQTTILPAEEATPEEEGDIVGCSDESILDPESDCFEG